MKSPRELFRFGIDPSSRHTKVPRSAAEAFRSTLSGKETGISDGQHLVLFDDAVKTMWKTGQYLASGYREKAEEGLVKIVRLRRRT